MQDISAWSEIISRYGNQAYSVAFHILKNESDADDATQNIFLRLQTYAHNYDSKYPLKPWLLQLASREAIRYYQKLKSINTKESKLMESHYLNASSANQQLPGEIEKSEMGEILTKALETLPENSRLVITLYFLGGLTQKEIAKELGLSQFSISEKINKSLEKIKMHFKKAGVSYSFALTPVFFQDNLINKKISNSLIEKITNAKKNLEPAPSAVQKTSIIKSSSSKIVFSIVIIFIISSLFFYKFSKQSQTLTKDENKEADSVLKTITFIEEMEDIHALPLEKFQKNQLFTLGGVKLKCFNTTYIDLNVNKITPTYFEVKPNSQRSGNLPWNINKKNTNDFQIERSSNSRNVDGFYLNMIFEDAFIFSGKLSIKENTCNIGFVLASDLPQSIEGINCQSLESYNIKANRSVQRITVLNAGAGREVDFKIYILPDKKQSCINVISYIKCKGFPESIKVVQMENASVGYEYGIVSDGNILINDLRINNINSFKEILQDPLLRPHQQEIPISLQNLLNNN